MFEIDKEKTDPETAKTAEEFSRWLDEREPYINAFLERVDESLRIQALLDSLDNLKMQYVLAYEEYQQTKADMLAQNFGVIPQAYLETYRGRYKEYFQKQRQIAKAHRELFALLEDLRDKKEEIIAHRIDFSQWVAEELAFREKYKEQIAKDREELKALKKELKTFEVEE